MLDHLLDEHAFDGLVAGAYVSGAEPMKRQDGGEERDRSDRGGSFAVHAEAAGPSARDIIANQCIIANHGIE